MYICVYINMYVCLRVYAYIYVYIHKSSIMHDRLDHKHTDKENNQYNSHRTITIASEIIDLDP